jgi:hypothetical protein
MSMLTRTGETAAVRTGRRGVYIVPLHAIDLEALPARIEGRPITALAPHPDEEDYLYVTTGQPESLAFLGRPYVDLRE